MSIERDYILRMISRLALVVAAMLGFRRRKDIEGALQELHEAYGDMFVPLGDSIARLDAESAMALIDDPGKLFALGRLLHEEGKLMNLKAAPLDAARFEARARTLVEEALRREPALMDVDEFRELIWFAPGAAGRGPSAEPPDRRDGPGTLLP